MSKKHPVCLATRAVSRLTTFLKALTQLLTTAQILLAVTSALAITVASWLIPPEPTSTPEAPRCRPDTLTPALIQQTDERFYATHREFPRHLSIELWDHESIEAWWAMCDQLLIQQRFQKNPIGQRLRKLKAKGSKNFKQRPSRAARPRKPKASM